MTSEVCTMRKGYLPSDECTPYNPGITHHEHCQPNTQCVGFLHVNTKVSCSSIGTLCPVEHAHRRLQT